MRSDHPPLLSVPAFPLQTSTQGFETLIIRPHPVLRTWTSKRIPRSRKHCKCTDWNPNTLSKSPNYKPLESWPSFASGQIFHPCLLSFPVATCPKARCEVAMFNKLCASRSLRWRGMRWLWLHYFWRFPGCRRSALPHCGFGYGVQIQTQLDRNSGHPLTRSDCTLLSGPSLPARFRSRVRILSQTKNWAIHNVLYWLCL